MLEQSSFRKEICALRLVRKQAVHATFVPRQPHSPTDQCLGEQRSGFWMHLVCLRKFVSKVHKVARTFTWAEHSSDRPQNCKNFSSGNIEFFRFKNECGFESECLFEKKLTSWVAIHWDCLRSNGARQKVFFFTKKKQEGKSPKFLLTFDCFG